MEEESKIDWLRFYPYKFLSSIDIKSMNATAVGGYIMLLVESFATDGYLPNDDKVLRMLSKLTKSEWKKHSPSILKKFEKNSEKIFNKVWVFEINNSKQNVKVKKERAILAAKTRWDAQKGQKSDAQALHEQSASNADAMPLHNITLHNITDNKEKKIAAKAAFPEKIKKNIQKAKPVVENSLHSQCRLYVEKKYPEKNHETQYYWTASDGKSLNELIKKLQFSFRTARQTEPTEKNLYEAFKLFYDNLPGEYYPKQKLNVLSSKYEPIISEIR